MPWRQLRDDAEVAQQLRVGLAGAPVDSGGLVQRCIGGETGGVERVRAEEAAETVAVGARAEGGRVSVDQLVQVAVEPHVSTGGLGLQYGLGEAADQSQIYVVAQVGRMWRQWHVAAGVQPLQEARSRFVPDGAALFPDRHGMHIDHQQPARARPQRRVAARSDGTAQDGNGLVCGRCPQHA